MARIFCHESQVSFAYHRLLWAISCTVLILLLTAGTLFADRDLTCKLKDANQKAEYHCPENFDAVVVGEGTDQCDGGCYAKGNMQSLSATLKDILAYRFRFDSSADLLLPLALELQQQGFVQFRSLEKAHGRLPVPDGLSFRIKQNIKK